MTYFVFMYEFGQAAGGYYDFVPDVFEEISDAVGYVTDALLDKFSCHNRAQIVRLDKDDKGLKCIKSASRDGDLGIVWFDARGKPLYTPSQRAYVLQTMIDAVTRFKAEAHQADSVDRVAEFYKRKKAANAPSERKGTDG